MISIYRGKDHVLFEGFFGGMWDWHERPKLHLAQ